MRLNVHDVATLLYVSEKTVYRWVAAGKIPSYRVGDQIRFSRSELVEWTTEKRIEVSPEIHLEDAAETGRIPSLAEAIELGNIVYRVQAEDRDSALRGVVRMLRLPADVDPDLIYQMLRVREELGSTGIGDGISVPHPRRQVLMQVEQPSVTLCFLDHPVDFAALDGKPVFALFTILSPTAKAHLQLMSRIAFVLHDPGVKAAVTEQATRDVILDEIRRVEASLAPANPPRTKIGPRR